MKSKLVGMAGVFAYVFIAVTSMQVNAEEINVAVSGSVLCLGLDEAGFCRATVAHTASKPIENTGEKYWPNQVAPSQDTTIKEGNTAVGYAGTTVSLNPQDPTLPSCIFKDQETLGLLFVYDYSSTVSTRPNGDLIYVELDDTKPSSVCVNTFVNKYEVTVYSKITGGTGQFVGACGWVEYNGTGIFLAPDTSLASTVGTQVGEIFVGDDCP